MASRRNPTVRKVEDAITEFSLIAGAGNASDRQACAMTLLAWVAGEDFVDHPPCAHSTIANIVERELHALGVRTYLLDGDNVRHGLNKDLGFTAADRVENIRRTGEVARLMVDAGLVVITAFISPFRSERQLARSMVGADEFVEIFIDTPLSTVEQRDPKGLYKKARLVVKRLSKYQILKYPKLRTDCS